MTRRLVLSVTAKDCEFQTFRCGGSGGQNVNKVSTGVRWVHRESGATGQSCDERSQLQNKKLAWKRMAESKKFQAWLKMKMGGDLLADVRVQERVRRDMHDANIKVEVKVGGQWVEESVQP